jgi:hypothetical protein
MPTVDVAEHRHSGKLGNGPLVVPLVGIPASVLLAWAYAYVTVYSPIVGYISILFVLGFAFAVGGCVGFAGHVAKVRNPGFMALAGLVVGLFAVYADFAAFEAVLLAKEDVEDAPGYFDLLAAPGAVWDLASLIAETGWYAIGSFDVAGLVLWGFWAVEALVVVAISAGLAWGVIAGAVFCERCNQWCDEHEGGIRLEMPADDAALSGVKAGSVRPLEDLRPVHEPTPGVPHLLVELHRCTACRETATIQLKSAVAKVDEKGKTSEETEDLSPTVSVGADGLSRLESLAAKASGTPPDGP